MPSFVTLACAATERGELLVSSSGTVFAAGDGGDGGGGGSGGGGKGGGGKSGGGDGGGGDGVGVLYTLQLP